MKQSQNDMQFSWCQFNGSNRKWNILSEVIIVEFKVEFIQFVMDFLEFTPIGPSYSRNYII